MHDDIFLPWLAQELASLRHVDAVALGGSRATGSALPSSDWDLAVYYRGSFDPAGLRAKGWPGLVSEVGGWGGGVMNGGAWLTIEGRRVDVHYRDLDEVERRVVEAQEGRFEKQLLLSYVAGIPTYVLVAELALNIVLVGALHRPAYPPALARTASRRWAADSAHSLAYARAAAEVRGDVVVATANGARGLIEAAHAQLAARGEWVVNEKGILQLAGLERLGTQLVAAVNAPELVTAVAAIERQLADAAGNGPIAGAAGFERRMS